VLAASIIKVIALMMKAANTSETMVNFYQTTQYTNPENSHLQNIEVTAKATSYTEDSTLK
jgi:hypothetical protein